MLEWLLESFPIVDREISDVHAPFMLAYLVSWIDVRISTQQQANDLTQWFQETFELCFSVAEVDTLMHILEMLVALLPADADAAQDSAHLNESKTSVGHLVSEAQAYYASEAEMRPPTEPSVCPSVLIAGLFQNLTSSTMLVGLRQRLRHHQQLALLQALVKKLMSAGQRATIDWNRDDFLDWIVSILKVFGFPCGT